MTCTGSNGQLTRSDLSATISILTVKNKARENGTNKVKKKLNSQRNQVKGKGNDTWKWKPKEKESWRLDVKCKDKATRPSQQNSVAIRKVSIEQKNQQMRILRNFGNANAK
jgi:hypothetical protein